MPFQANTYRVMIASPSDLKDERRAVRSAIYDWNDLHAARQSAVLLPVMWETHVSPMLGHRPQALINELVKQCDILVALFWWRLGSPTGCADSGTIEELDLALALKKPTLIFRSVRPYPPQSDAEGFTEQLGRLEKFLKDISRSNKALIYSFDSPDALLKQFSSDLTREVWKLKPKLRPASRGRADGGICEVQLNASHIAELVKNSVGVRIIRSGFTPGVLNNFIDAIRKGCKGNTAQRKSIKIILPSAENEEVERRAADFARHRSMGETPQSPATIRQSLSDWYAAINQLKEEMREYHDIYVIKSYGPYRYHLYAGDKEAYLGVAWHSFGSMLTRSIRIRAANELFLAIDSDFDQYWRDLERKQSQS
jgi:hypothetical protein